MSAQASSNRQNTHALGAGPDVSLSPCSGPPQACASRPPQISTLDLDEAARLLKVHAKTLQRLAQAGRVPACKIGRAWIFVEQLLVDHMLSKSVLRVSVVDLQEKSECRSTDARTHRFGGSSYRQSGVNRSLYSKALGLPTDAKRSRFETGSQLRDGSKTASG